jgi:hypothetical protein
VSEGPLSREAIEAELARTAYQRKIVGYAGLQETADHAIEFFKQRGYRAGRTGRPNQVFVRGGREGLLPAVHAELLIQVNVGRSNATMVSVSGAGEKLSLALQEYAEAMREEGRRRRQQRDA